VNFKKSASGGLGGRDGPRKNWVGRAEKGRVLEKKKKWRPHLRTKTGETTRLNRRNDQDTSTSPIYREARVAKASEKRGKRASH